MFAGIADRAVTGEIRAEVVAAGDGQLVRLGGRTDNLGRDDVVRVVQKPHASIEEVRFAALTILARETFGEPVSERRVRPGHRAVAPSVVPTAPAARGTSHLEQSFGA